MKKFEYRIETLDKKIFAFSSSDVLSDMEQQLNNLGEKGWELCAIQGNTAFLKREIIE